MPHLKYQLISLISYPLDLSMNIHQSHIILYTFKKYYHQYISLIESIDYLLLLYQQKNHDYYINYIIHQFNRQLDTIYCIDHNEALFQLKYYNQWYLMFYHISQYINTIQHYNIFILLFHFIIVCNYNELLL
mgnify:CR=1 FL=1